MKRSATAILLAIILSAPGPGSDAFAQLSLPRVPGPLDRPLERTIDRVERVKRDTERKVEEAADDAAEDAGDAVETATGTIESVTGEAASLVDGAASTVLRAFELGADPAGWPIEERTVVILLDAAELDTAVAAGLTLVQRRDLPSLGLTLATFRESRGMALADVIGDLRRRLPAASVDYNHVYRTQAATQDVEPAAAAAEGAAAGFRVGMIDSAVDADHPVLAGSGVVRRSFVTNEGIEPTGHGTAVASIIAASSRGRAAVLAASVFFQTPNHAPGATTESLVAALDWLASEGVHAINMSLAGPANALLERALGVLSETGPVVVAAVGNNGPSGEPLYPGAYDSVLGVTAVDRERKIFRYANRGPHVDFAALGVDVRVAHADTGSWTLQSGTSMASPRVAVLVAAKSSAGRLSLPALVSLLVEDAEDLGQRGFDPVFGNGYLGDPPELVSRH